MKHLTTTLLALMVSLCALAQVNRVHIEDFEVAPDSTVKVPLLLTNADATRGVQFNLTLPAGLQLEDYEMTKYSKAHKMNSFGNINGDVWTLGLYPRDNVQFESGNAVVIMMLEFIAEPDFKGGDIILWKQRGSTMENQTIYFDDYTTRVTLPQP